MPAAMQFAIDPNIARASTLPATLYTDPEVFASEQEKIFARSWQLVGHRRQVEKSGDYFTCQVAGEPVLIARGTDDRRAPSLTSVGIVRGRLQKVADPAKFSAASTTVGPTRLTVPCSIPPKCKVWRVSVTRTSHSCRSAAKSGSTSCS
jgi:hypothetical protein